MFQTTLAHVLTRYPGQFRPTSTIVPLGGAGGLSGGSLWRYDSTAGPMTLRAWPAGVACEHVERIHGWLGEAVALPYLALPVATRDGRTVIEHEARPFHLEPWMRGVPDLANPPTAARVDAAFSGLASSIDGWPAARGWGRARA